MDLLRFEKRFQGEILVGRYGFYASYFALCVALGAWGFATFCLCTPVAMHVVQKSRRRGAWRAAYTLECVLGVAGAIAAELTLVMTLVLALVYAAVNVALWGPRAWWSVGGAGGAAAIMVAARGPLNLSTAPLLDLVALCVAGAFVLGMATLAHRQAQTILSAKRSGDDARRALLRYFPRDFPAHLRERGEGGVARVWLSVAFVDLGGFAAATRHLPPEELGAMLNDFFRDLNQLVELWGGTISKFTGDGGLCVFGGGARGNAALQCVRCVTQLPGVLDRLHRDWRGRGLAQEFGVTAGVASGMCAIGDWGSRARWDYTVVGEPVNLAARLQARAGDAGGVLVDAPTVRLTRDAVDFGAAIQLTLKGLGATEAYVPSRRDPATRETPDGARPPAAASRVRRQTAAAARPG